MFVLKRPNLTPRLKFLVLRASLTVAVLRVTLNLKTKFYNEQKLVWVILSNPNHNNNNIVFVDKNNEKEREKKSI